MAKRTASDYASDGGFVQDTSFSTTPNKRARPSTANAKKSAEDKAPVSTSQQTDDSGDPFWELSSGGTRRVTVNTFKGKTMVNVREYYEKDGTKLPGKKGISLPVEQWVALLEAAPAIEREVTGRGETCGRPDYGDVDGANDVKGGVAAKDEDGDERGRGDDKKNFESTSEEDGA